MFFRIRMREMYKKGAKKVMTEKAERNGSKHPYNKRNKKDLDKNKELRGVLGEKVNSVENGSVTVIVQDHKPIQINVYHKIL